MPVNEDIFDNIPIGQKPLIWPTVQCEASTEFWRVGDLRGPRPGQLHGGT